MKQTRRFAAILLVAMTVLVSVPGFPTAVCMELSNPDTLALTQAAYSEVISSLSRLDSNQEKIQHTIETFLRMSKAKSRDFNGYDLTALVDASSAKSPKINYYLKTLEYRYLIDKASRINTVVDNVLFDDFRVTIKEGQAKASVVERYVYVIQGRFNRKCSRTKEYTFELGLADNKWSISAITTNDPWEEDPSFRYADFDAKLQIDKAMTNTECQSPNESDGMRRLQEKIATKELTRTPAYFWTYDRDWAVDYAGRYYDDINSLYGEADNDCQNFASQCVWAGLKENTSITVPPVVYDSSRPSSNPRLWQRGNSCTNAPYGSGWYWDNVNGFFYLIDSSIAADNVGPYGWVNFGNVDYAEPGDVISYAGQEASAGNSWCLLGYMYHAMVVTEVSGTSGSRSLSDLCIAAHNDPSNSADQPLLEYTVNYTDELTYSTARIGGGYYNVGQ